MGGCWSCEKCINILTCGLWLGRRPRRTASSAGSAKDPLLRRSRSKGSRRHKRHSSRASALLAPQAWSSQVDRIEQQLEQQRRRERHEAPPSTENLLQQGYRDVTQDYELQELLGQGAFGVVRVVQHRLTGQRFACKTLSKAQMRRRVDVEDCKREVQIQQTLSSHPNVAALVATYEDDNAVHLIMELCEGGELFERIAERGSLTEREAARYFRSIVEVVAHCHALSIMHRDIKPENFLLTSKDTDAVIKAADFGLSQYFRPGRPFTSLAGSAGYVAPEVLKRRYGPSADVWSLGVLLYILLSGLTPFWGDTEEQIFDMVLHADIDLETAPWPSISSHARQLVKRMMSRDPGKRPTPAELLASPWLNEAAPDRPLDAIVIQRMRTFAAMHKVKRAAMVLAVQGLSEDQLPELHALFHSLDADQSGGLTMQEFRVGLQRLGHVVSEEEATCMVEAADVDGDGTIDFAEFVAATLGRSHTGKEDFVRALFKRLDLDSSGRITAHELRGALGKWGVSGGEAEAVVQHADVDGDGEIDFNEFFKFMVSNTESIQEIVRRRLPSAQLDEATLSTSLGPPSWQPPPAPRRLPSTGSGSSDDL